MKAACDSIQVQAIPWSTHHASFIVFGPLLLPYPFHTTPPSHAKLMGEALCLHCTATNCHLLDPALILIAEGIAYKLTKNLTTFSAKIFSLISFMGETYFLWLIDQYCPAEKVGCNWHLCWPCLMSVREAGTLVQRGRANTSPAFYLRQWWEVPTTHITKVPPFPSFSSPEAAAIIASDHERTLANCVESEKGNSHS